MKPVGSSAGGSGTGLAGLRSQSRTKKKVNLSNDDAKLVLPESKFAGSNRLPSAKSQVLKSRSFEPVRLFTLNVNLAAVSGKTNGDKLITARKLAIHKKIVINDDVRQVNKHSDQIIVVKEIPIDLSRSAVKSVFSKFEKIVSIKIQLIGLWQKALVKYESSEVASSVASKALLYTLPVGTTAHNLSGLLESYDGRTCFIGCNFGFYVCDRCAVVCFENKASKLAAIGSIPVYKNVNLCWAGLSLACCTKYKQLGHISTVCLLDGNSGVHGKWVVTLQDQICLANIYKKKQMLIICPVFFGKKTWTQVAGSSFSCVVLSGSLESSLFLGTKSVPIDSNFFSNSYLVDWLASLKCFLELLTDQISGIMKKLSFMELVPLVSKLLIPPLVVLTSVAPNLDSDMALDVTPVSFFPSLLIVTDPVSDLGLSSSKVLTSKVGDLESKIVALEVSVESVLKKLDCLCSGLVNKFNRVWMFTSGLDSGHMGSEIAIAMNNSLTKHVYKVSEVSGQLLSIKLLFKNKLSVSILGLYAGVSALVWFS
ncbi:hypothetical protein G9A89_018385 [Geosiphon pyriformis]|nr:hypothetical protein G9A89_018385 [Geosiphon pyriformis]